MFPGDSLEMVNIRQLDRVGENEGTGLWLALDEVMDPQNLGAIVRPACFLVHRGFGSVSSLAVDINEGVKTFIANLNTQLSAGKLQRIVLVIVSKATTEVLERWNFSIETDKEVVEKGVSIEKSDKEIMREIQAIMRQIASSITYLPW
ncbi:putative mitotic spindle checkpoint protein Mad2 [Helianthus annuus]|nr:putative HORMA domain, alpha/beta knot methyltransferase, HORMA domain superfamily [Helianthus annuus]KAJ0533821.1 putative mitotic spindle checkpoint protein Mad2 [Helianthus annuus]KAJ0542011.1 putative HORMA domain, alpha/beta knot methyltransferase, HORMA domain superfamily [Helianthus annuus]KAJ0707076.1 putative HORMA domain, alpha/beta knot methyltransferase, HORMA domain superfamily [Helianthus annuus]KAJ0711098.1 putative HORMA domain, alpha/beta knot methyltransferase, HORMA domain